jgi:hypothetical protein
MKSLVEKDSVLRNDENALVIEINGAGNFQKIVAPVVNWPQAIEALEPVITDNFDRQQVPLTGQRRFKYIFLSNKPGRHTIPAVSFSFFDVKSKKYKRLSTSPHTFTVGSSKKKDKALTVAPISSTSNSKVIRWFSIGGLTILIAGLFLWTISKKEKTKKKAQQEQKIKDELAKFTSIEELLKPAASTLEHTDSTFFKNLDDAIWSYFNQRFLLSGSQMNKPDLAMILISKGIPTARVDEMMQLIQQCERGLYTNVSVDLGKKQLFEDTLQMLKEVEAICS